ncbi:MAG: peptidylprolyl isomerase [Pseudomonadales bacterium]
MFILKTNYGDIEIELDHEKAPISAKNFADYANSGFYDGTIFHRVIDGFMVQGGGFDESMQQKSGNEPIENEANNGLKNETGTLAMARTMDPHSASSQFFINVADNGFLNHTAETSQGWGYAVFGRVIGGMDVVNKIKTVKTGSSSGHQDVPIDTVVVETIVASE